MVQNTQIKTKESKDTSKNSSKAKVKYVKNGTIHEALRLLDYTISNKLLDYWLENAGPVLDWNNPERRMFEAKYREEIGQSEEYKERLEPHQIWNPYQVLGKTKFLLPHEWLYLLCNCCIRSEII